jgi:hypothetical protein
MVVGLRLEPCTTELGVETIDGHPPRESSRLNLIDTPGFDGTIERDFAIMTKIATWLKDSYVVLKVYKPRYKLIGYHSYKEGAKLGGFIYLYDITGSRFDDPARRNLEMFQRVCGKGVLDHVVLGTTKWGLNVPGSEERHELLVSKYWKPLIDKGAQVRRFDGGHESAQNLIDAISWDSKRSSEIRANDEQQTLQSAHCRVSMSSKNQSAKQNILILYASFLFFLKFLKT